MSLRDNIKQESKKKKSKQEIDDTSTNVEIAYNEYGDVDEEKTQKNIRTAVKRSTEKYNEGKYKPERFMWVKMWISYLVSLTMKDRGKIPDNIGDRILISNNMYITKLYMSTIIHIYELGTSTPVTLMS